VASHFVSVFVQKTFEATIPASLRGQFACVAPKNVSEALDHYLAVFEESRVPVERLLELKEIIAAIQDTLVGMLPYALLQRRSIRTLE
jgi:hypothetical protein